MPATPPRNDGPNVRHSSDTETERLGRRAVGRLKSWRTVSYAFVVFATGVVLAKAQDYSANHAGIFPLGMSIGELILLAAAMLILGTTLITYLFAGAEHKARTRYDMLRPDSPAASLDELDKLRETSKTSGPVIGVTVICLLASLSACDRLNLTGSNAVTLVLFFGAALATWVLCVFLAGAIGDLTSKRAGWTKEAEERYFQLQKESWDARVRARPEEFARRRDAAERAASRKREDNERALQSDAERKAQAERFYAASEGVRRRAAAESARESSAKRAHKKNPALCPKCGSADIVVLGENVKPSLVGAAIGSSYGVFGAAAGATLLGKRRRELMCRKCGTRWLLK